jgi:hypothetical protein
MTPVANILVNVVPSLLARRPPSSGVQVEFRLNAETSKLNSVLEVPMSRCSRDLSGPRMYEALPWDRVSMVQDCDVDNILVTPDTERTCT